MTTVRAVFGKGSLRDGMNRQKITDERGDERGSSRFIVQKTGDTEQGDLICSLGGGKDGWDREGTER